MLGISDDGLGHYGIRLLKVGMIYPLDAEIVGNFARGLDEIIVVEEKRAFVETAIKDLLYGTANPPRVIGKLDPSGQVLVSASGELDTDSVATALARRLGNEYAIEPVLEWQKRSKRARIELPLLTRTPYFCSGCPHNSSTRVPEGSIVGGGIGCHGMTMFMDDKLVGNVLGVTQMGGEGAQWLGLAPFADEKHFIQHIGDGTFTHSGSLAIRAAVASGENITYKLLYNSTVAMTGGQDPVGAFHSPTPHSAAMRRRRGKDRRHDRRLRPCPFAKPAQRGRGPRPRRDDRGAAGTRRSARHDRPHPRPGVRGRKAPQAQTRTDRDTDVQSGDQRTDL